METKLMCWDYNETIIGYGRDEIRPNIAEVLAALRERGYKNIVTTTISERYVEQGLRQAGLDSLIDGVFGGVRDPRLRAKRYREAVESVGIPIEQASERVVVVGDKPHDHPCDLADVVFILNPEGYKADARVVQALLLRLEEHGNGNILAGFDGLNQFSFADGHIELPCGYDGILHYNSYGHSWQTPEIIVKPAAQSKSYKDLAKMAVAGGK